jgi:flagellin FlaB
MLRKLIKRIYGQQKGITGLETAIILIAFVVVAAVFAYTVLSAGLFATQKSQEAVYSGLERTQSTMELKSGVVAKAETVGGPTAKIGQLIFTLAIATGGESIDFTNPSNNGSGMATGNNYVTISLSDKYQRVDNLAWTSAAVGIDNSNNLLEPNEQFEITVGGASGVGDLVDALGTDLAANSTFLVEIKTAKGAVMSFERTLPGYINTVNDLH